MLVSMAAQALVGVSIEMEENSGVAHESVECLYTECDEDQPPCIAVNV